MADFYVLGNSTRTQMFGCIIQTKTKTIVIDGGELGDYKQLADFLYENANSHVDAWFFTHPHKDHIGAFCNIGRYAPDITVDRLYYRFPTVEDLDKYGGRAPDEQQCWGETDNWKYAYDVYNFSEGEIFRFDEVAIRVLRVYNPNILENFVNNSCAVFRIEGAKNSVLILGDIGTEGGDEVMSICPRELLYADYTQMAHHGQFGVSREFYEYIKPMRCIWPSPQWLWDNDAGDGFDTGPWATVRTREWMDELGVKTHIIEKDGTQKIDFE